MQTTATDLFERYHVAVYRYFRRATGSHDLAQDLTQELFLHVVRSLGNYRPEKEAGWVFRIARNLMVDYHRTHPSRTVALSDADPVRVDPTQLVAFGVWEALALLPPQEREAFLLREVGGLSYAEVAVVCETKTETIRARLYQARCRLKALLGSRAAADDKRRRTQDG